MRAQVLDFAQVDSWRAQRTGFPEVVFGGGKSAAQIAAIMAAQARNDQVVLATRIAPEVRRTPMHYSWRPCPCQHRGHIWCGRRFSWSGSPARPGSSVDVA